MPEIVITTANKAELIAFIRSIPGRITGRVRDPQGVGAGFRARIGWTFFSLVAESFKIKGRGGTDSAGDSWAPNTRAYLAYRKGRAKKRKVGTAFRVNRRDHLTDAQSRLWAKVNRKAITELTGRLPQSQVRGVAAQKAWAATRQEGAGTLLANYGSKPDQVLVDRGDLRRSLQPGDLVESVGPAASYGNKPQEQIFEESIGLLVVGSRDKKAASHHLSKRLRHGDPGKGTIRRRLWPERLPDDWFRQIMGTASSGLKRIAQLVSQGDIAA